MNSDKVGERIRRIRKSKKLSMKDLAKKVGVSFSYIAKIETGQNRINVEMLYGIAHALRVSLDSLLGTEDEEEKELKEKGWHTLRDFYVVRYDSLGRPEKAFYNIQNEEANIIGQLRELEREAPEIAEEIFEKFSQFTESKDPEVFSSWLDREEEVEEKSSTEESQKKSKKKKKSSKKK